MCCTAKLPPKLNHSLLSGDKVVNGDKEKAEGSGGEEEPEEEPCQFYDKTKSFFDNISCEATERAKR